MIFTVTLQGDCVLLEVNALDRDHLDEMIEEGVLSGSATVTIGKIKGISGGEVVGPRRPRHPILQEPPERPVRPGKRRL